MKSQAFENGLGKFGSWRSPLAAGKLATAGELVHDQRVNWVRVEDAGSSWGGKFVRSNLLLLFFC